MAFIVIPKMAASRIPGASTFICNFCIRLVVKSRCSLFNGVFLPSDFAQTYRTWTSASSTLIHLSGVHTKQGNSLLLGIPALLDRRRSPFGFNRAAGYSTGGSCDGGVSTGDRDAARSSSSSGTGTSVSLSSPYAGSRKNTYLTESRVTEDYLLEPFDLDGLPVFYIRSASSEAGKSENAYEKLDVEQRALEKWGSWTAFKRELEKRRGEEEDVERKRRGISTINARLMRSQKQFSRRKVDDEAYGGEDARRSMLKGTATVVGFAIASNFAVMVMKCAAYLYTGSAAMLSETIHSLADLLNQCWLAAGIIKSIEQPDPDHPYGFSSARYVYSLISGVAVFFVGAGVTSYHGFMAMSAPHVLESLPMAYTVLGVSFVMEGLTLSAAIKQVRRGAQDSGLSFKDYIRRGKDPSVIAVFMEDSAAVIGVVIASVSILLTHLTGNCMYDALGSITIGGLLGAVAVFLIRMNSDVLFGRTMDPKQLKEVVELLESDQCIHSAHDVKATDMGPDCVRFKAEIHIDGQEVTRVHLSKLDLEVVLKEIQSIKTVSEVERFLLEHGEHAVDQIGAEIDRVEIKIQKHAPDVRHIDLEII